VNLAQQQNNFGYRKQGFALCPGLRIRSVENWPAHLLESERGHSQWWHAKKRQKNATQIHFSRDPSAELVLSRDRKNGKLYLLTRNAVGDYSGEGMESFRGQCPHCIQEGLVKNTKKMPTIGAGGIDQWESCCLAGFDPLHWEGKKKGREGGLWEDPPCTRTHSIILSSTVRSSREGFQAGRQTVVAVRTALPGLRDFVFTFLT
jgi:hypothetical protein